MRILIADDDPYSLKIIRLMLASEQCYEVVTVADGLAAWRELDEGLGFNLCIFDLMMPELDGFELTARLRADARFRQQRVIFCTALNDRETIGRALALGVSHYIVKPYTKELVLRQVRRVAEDAMSGDYFESISDVSLRLGASVSVVKDLLVDLHADLVRVESALVGGAPPEHVRVNALKSAAVNLGARALAVRLGQLEAALLTTGDCSRVATTFAAEVERLRVQLKLPKPAPTPLPAATDEPGAAQPAKETEPTAAPPEARDVVAGRS